MDIESWEKKSSEDVIQNTQKHIQMQSEKGTTAH